MKNKNVAPPLVGGGTTNQHQQASRTMHTKPPMIVLLFTIVMCTTLLMSLPGCPNVTDPFADAPVIERNGQPRRLTTDIVSLGPLTAGQVINLTVAGDTVQAFLLLQPDTAVPGSGIVIGGGPEGIATNYRVPADNDYFVFVQLDPNADIAAAEVTLTATDGDATFTPPAAQRVLVEFADGYLTNPGLFDPDSGTQEMQDFLAEISGQVQDGIIERLNDIFAGTPIEIFDGRDGQPDAPFSTLTFSPDRVELDPTELSIDAVAPPLTDNPECDDLVIFGEVLSNAVGQDSGNQIPDDDAVVYVGSFQGRGDACQTSAINSVNNIVNGLAQTGAHEIGHLVGLYHVALFDIMDRSPSMAFQRELEFMRGQILVEQAIETTDGRTDVATIVLTNIVQDPTIYFNSVFASPDN